MDFDLWRRKERSLELPLKTCTAHSIKFQMEVHEVLVPKSLHEATPHRNFKVVVSFRPGFASFCQSSAGDYFVNTSWLTEEMGGSLFADWHSLEQRGHGSVAPTGIGEPALGELLRACCAYPRVIVSR